MARAPAVYPGMGVLGRRVVDDRGWKRELLGTGLGLGAATDGASLPPEGLACVKARLRRWGRMGRTMERMLVALVVMGVLGVGGVGWLTWRAKVVQNNAVPMTWRPVPAPPGLRMHWWLIAGASAAAALALLNRRGLRAWRPQVVRDVLLAEGRCPSCGYGLAGRGLGEDGCVECAECGGAWRLPECPCRGCRRELSRMLGAPDGLVECPVCGERCAGAR